jgi:hypothetical protein
MTEDVDGPAGSSLSMYGDSSRECYYLLVESGESCKKAFKAFAAARGREHCVCC